MDRAPQAYEPTYETPAPGTLCNTAFLRSASGILKTCEIVLSCVVLICVASSHSWSYHHSGGWVTFVGAFSLIITSLLFIFYVFNLIQRLPGPWVLIEFCALVLCTVCWFIAFAVAAAYSSSYQMSAITATAVFSFLAMVAFIVELVLRFRVTRENNMFRITMAAVRTVPPAYPGSSSTGPGLNPNTAPAAPRPAGGYPGNYPGGGATDHDFVMP